MTSFGIRKTKIHALRQGRYSNNREVVLAAVRQNGKALCFASEVLRDDRDIVLAAVRQNGRAICSASQRMRDDKEVAIAAVEYHPFMLNKISLALRGNRDVVLTAVKNLVLYKKLCRMQGPAPRCGPKVI